MLPICRFVKDFFRLRVSGMTTRSPHGPDGGRLAVGEAVPGLFPCLCLGSPDDIRLLRGEIVLTRSFVRSDQQITNL